MAVFKYIAIDRGDLVSGHSAQTEYSIEIALTEWTPQKKQKKSMIEPMDGPMHVLLLGLRRRYDFTTIPIDDVAIIAEFEEMFDSIAAGEIFWIDPFGTIAVPDNEITVQIVGTQSSARIGQTEFQFSAKVEKYEA